MPFFELFSRLRKRGHLKRCLRNAQKEERLVNDQIYSLREMVQKAGIVWDQWVSVELHKLYKVRDQFERKVLELKRQLYC